MEPYYHDASLATGICTPGPNGLGCNNASMVQFDDQEAVLLGIGVTWLPNAIYTGAGGSLEHPSLMVTVPAQLACLPDWCNKHGLGLLLISCMRCTFPRLTYIGDIYLCMALIGATHHVNAFMTPTKTPAGNGGTSMPSNNRTALADVCLNTTNINEHGFSGASSGMHAPGCDLVGMRASPPDSLCSTATLADFDFDAAGPGWGLPHEDPRRHSAPAWHQGTSMYAQGLAPETLHPARPFSCPPSHLHAAPARHDAPWHQMEQPSMGQQQHQPQLRLPEQPQHGSTFAQGYSLQHGPTYPAAANLHAPSSAFEAELQMFPQHVLPAHHHLMAHGSCIGAADAAGPLLHSRVRSFLVTSFFWACMHVLHHAASAGMRLCCQPQSSRGAAFVCNDDCMHACMHTHASRSCIATAAQGMAMGRSGLETATDKYRNQRQAMMRTPPIGRRKRPATPLRSPFPPRVPKRKRSARLQGPRQDFWTSDGTAPSEEVSNLRMP